MLPRLLRPQTPLRRAARCALRPANCLAQRRCIQTVPPISNYGDAFKENGVPGLLSRSGFNIAWTQYQGMIVDKLNSIIAGYPFENNQPKDLIVQFAREPQFASVFNYSSMAFNNHFFFKILSPERTSIPAELDQSLSDSFTSIDTLRSEFLATADAMFGPGFVWLVWHQQRNSAGSWRILPTYLAGSPLAGAHWRQQPVDMNTQSVESAGGLSGRDYARQTEVQNTVGYIGPNSAQGKEQSKLAPGGANVVPVLCVNTWEHVWLTDYGIGGKRDFLETWWDRIDWNEVQSMVPDTVFTKSRGFYR